jgi:hypothetical protein
VAPLQNWDATKDFTFSAEELEKLAIDEHDRCCDERLADGWKPIPMPKADDEDEVNRLLEEAKRRKESPYLIPWADLLELYPKVAEYDRLLMRKIPARLASFGLQAIRTETTETPPAIKQAAPA